MDKRQLEREAITLFLKLHNTNNSAALRLLYQQERPDAVLMDQSRNKIGLEITHLFYSEQEARQLLKRDHQSFVCVESFDHFVEQLNRQLSRKEEKSVGYRHDYPLALLIRNMSRHFGWSDFNQVWDKVKADSKAFTSIWFLTKDHPDQDTWFLIDLRNRQSID